jgi:hypothetical protein
MGQLRLSDWIINTVSPRLTYSKSQSNEFYLTLQSECHEGRVTGRRIRLLLNDSVRIIGPREDIAVDKMPFDGHLTTPRHVPNRTPT